MHPTQQELWDYFHDEVERIQKESTEQHLGGCEPCRERLALLAREEEFFLKMDFPLPSEEFASKTVERVLLHRVKVDKFWVLAFKVSLALSLLLMLVAIVWISDPVAIDVSKYFRAIILYGTPIALLVLIMNYFDKPAVQY